MKTKHKDILHCSGCVLIIAVSAYGYQMDNPTKTLPRNQILPLFEPHRRDFSCATEASKLTPLDAQADAWFREARALEDPSIFFDDRDYKKVWSLTRMASDRRHWKAMLNLATFYLEGRDPEHGSEDAVKLVEDAMQMGVPAAYDRMGTYFMNGTGVRQDATRAYAFWQRAAELGNPDALAHLASRLNVGEDREGYWSNIPVALKMMECAFGQGYSNVADDLHFLYAEPMADDGSVVGERNSETKTRALKMLHGGVKLGCAGCAFELWRQFGKPESLARMLAPFIDPARAARYMMLGQALEFNPYRRFPNLDKIVPLPPAVLPPWDGTRESLLAAAAGVVVASTQLPAKPPATPDRYYLDPAYRLRKSGEITTEPWAPFAGYWQPVVDEGPDVVPRQRALAQPGLYARGEAFDAILAYFPGSAAKRNKRYVIWEYYRTIPADPHAVAPLAVPVLVRAVPPAASPMQAKSDKPCPVSGIWQPWVADSHPLQSIVNQPWRQAFLRAGQPFPLPRQDWLLDLPEQEVTWHLMEADTR